MTWKGVDTELRRQEHTHDTYTRSNTLEASKNQLSFLSLTTGSSNVVVRVRKAATDHEGRKA